MGVVLLEPYRRSQRETVKALEDLLAEARAGGLIGFAYIALRPLHAHSAGLAGEARDPVGAVFTVGMLQVLEDELVKSIRHLPP